MKLISVQAIVQRLEGTDLYRCAVYIDGEFCGATEEGTQAVAEKHAQNVARLAQDVARERGLRAYFSDSNDPISRN